MIKKEACGDSIVAVCSTLVKERGLLDLTWEEGRWLGGSEMLAHAYVGPP